MRLKAMGIEIYKSLYDLISCYIQNLLSVKKIHITYLLTIMWDGISNETKNAENLQKSTNIQTVT